MIGTETILGYEKKQRTRHPGHKEFGIVRTLKNGESSSRWFRDEQRRDDRFDSLSRDLEAHGSTKSPKLLGSGRLAGSLFPALPPGFDWNGGVVKKTEFLKLQKRRSAMDSLKDYFAKHQDSIITLAVIVLLDHILFAGALRGRIQESVERILGAAEKQLTE